MNDQERQDYSSHPRILALLKKFSSLAGIIIFLAGLSTLSGSLLHVTWLENLFDPYLSAAFIFISAALLCLTREINPSLKKTLNLGFIILAVASAFIHFYQASNATGMYNLAHFIFLGFALGIIDLETSRKMRPTQALSLLVITLSLFAILVDLYKVPSFYEDMPASVFFIMLSTAILCLRPAQGIMQAITSNSVGGTLGRRLLPICIFVPAILGWIVLFGQRQGLYDRELLLVIVATSNILFFASLIWWLANFLFAVDVKRSQSEEVMRYSSLTDELTGLYNRRGFHTLAEQQLKTAKRLKQTCIVFFVDLDGLKKINDTHGHKEGDQALLHVTTILKKTFREVDIIARFAGDEFAVLCIVESPDRLTLITERLDAELKLFNAENPWLLYPLSFSVGAASFDGKNTTVDELMLAADKKLYEIKHAKKNADGQDNNSSKITPPDMGPRS